MTRVLIVEPAGQLWGSERALLDLIDASQTLDISVCCPPNTPIIAELDYRNIRTFPYLTTDLHQKTRIQRLIAAFGVLRACIQFRPDVIHLNQSGAYRIALPAGTLMRIPIVSHVRIFEDAAYFGKRRPSPKHLKGLIAISSAMEKELRTQSTLRAIAVHTVYDAYSPTKTCAFVSPIPTRQMRFACVGRIVPMKGQDILLDALAKTDELPKGCEFIFAGEGERAYVDVLKAKTTVQNRTVIQWLGFVGDPRTLLGTCGFLVCPSHREPLGRVILEAWDAGAVPIAYAGSGGAAEIIATAGAGILYDRQIPECIANTLRAALELSEDERSRIVENGRRWMMKQCSPQLYGKRISAILNAACSAPSFI